MVFLEGNLDPVGDDWSWKSRRWLDLNHFLVGVPDFLFFFSFLRRLAQQQQKKHSPNSRAAIAIEATEIPTVWPVVKIWGGPVGVEETSADAPDDEVGTVDVEVTLVLEALVVRVVGMVDTPVACGDDFDVGDEEVDGAAAPVVNKVKTE